MVSAVTAQSHNLPPPGSWRCWILAARPKTLFAAVAPVILGSALAAADSSFSPVAGLAALAGAVLIQIGTNLANDYWDGVKGADTPDRLGPPRAVACGLLPAPSVLAGAAVAFGLAAAAGLILFALAGWPVLVIGALSILCGLAYTAGPFPLAYVGLGDVFTFLFFGLAATAGTYFVHAGVFSPVAVLAGVMPGLYSVVLIALNNLRDRDGDLRAGKRTLAVRFGGSFARSEIVVCMALAAAVPVALWSVAGRPSLPAAALCAAYGLLETALMAHAITAIRHPAEINALFPRVGRASLLMAGLVSAALILR